MKAVDANKRLSSEIEEKLDTLDDMIAEGETSRNLKFIDRIFRDKIFPLVFDSKDDDYIGLAFHALTTLARDNKHFATYRPQAVEILNQAVCGINSIAVAKLLLDDLREFCREKAEMTRPTEKIWWFAQAGGRAISDLKPTIEKLHPEALSFFDWERPVDIWQNQKGRPAGAGAAGKVTTPAGKFIWPEAGTYPLNRENKAALSANLAEMDAYALENEVETLDYTHEAFEAICDELARWVRAAVDKRAAGETIFDIYEEIMAVGALLHGLLENDAKTRYAIVALKTVLSDFAASEFYSDGETATEDDAQVMRLDALEKAEQLLEILEQREQD